MSSTLHPPAPLCSGPSLEAQPPGKKITPLPRIQLAALCALVDPIAYSCIGFVPIMPCLANIIFFTSQIFPYINAMLSDLRVTDDPSKISFYSGLVESSYAFTQLLSIWQWSKLSDVVGRRRVVLSGTLGVVVTTLVFGLSDSLFSVILFRGLGGIFGGNIAVFHSILGELTDTSNQHRAYPIYGFIWPLLGGLFSNLDTRYPAYFGYEFIKRHPYFMPGFVSSGIAFSSLIFVYFFLDETLPSKRKRCSEETQTSSLGSDTTNLSPPTFAELLAIPAIRALTLSGFVLNFISSAFIVVFALFAYTAVEAGGLGFTVINQIFFGPAFDLADLYISHQATQIGYSLAISGIYLAPCRSIAATKIYNICMRAWCATFLFLPLLNFLARCESESTENRWGIVIVLVASRFGFLAFSASMILVRHHASRPSALGRPMAGSIRNVRFWGRQSHFHQSTFALSMKTQLVGGYVWV
ncbi:major facilitator superfamily domain-containing protein [Mycena leptocephala]|nr:major facilitator superfamily domain-containing protein [Mycena leptocephala]